MIIVLITYAFYYMILVFFSSAFYNISYFSFICNSLIFSISFLINNFYSFAVPINKFPDKK